MSSTEVNTLMYTALVMGETMHMAAMGAFRESKFSEGLDELIGTTHS